MGGFVLGELRMSGNQHGAGQAPAANGPFAIRTRRAWTARSAGLLALCVGASVLAACSSGTSGLTTGSLLSGKQPPADSSNERMLQVAATSARASRCGYNFDPNRLRAAYIAYEAAQGGDAQKLQKVEKSYDYTVTSVGQKIGPADEYCTDAQTAVIKTDLTRHLAGDFTPNKRVEASLADWWSSKKEDKFDPDKALRKDEQR